ncbi:hypothetical protein HF289_13020 [Acidithiobacillus ferrooxidans]|uniref:hypothetical protein n=1 Tax=Acidithiobacillus ferrooxidans TaxID=920 RepID=UPI000AB10EB4|nr:hypothetical protein [Acidithiobacillus ferrooxidans]MBU2857755.1 hypothetical protein [Acidithiobacillus ferrooxidans]
MPEQLLIDNHLVQRIALPFLLVNTPPAQAVGFKLRLKAGSVGTKADGCRYTT